MKDFPLYEFYWEGKAESKLLSTSTTSKQLILDKKRSKNLNSTQNIYIEGDNIDGLKLLLADYKNKVKMIYIDPPYNTRNSFVYNDDYKLKTDKRKSKNTSETEISRRYHINWLNMIYPRLLIAKELLKKDGIIFISIDDTEIFNLKLICDEVFGESNFISCCTRVAKRTSNKGTFFKSTKDYVLVYAKEVSNLEGVQFEVQPDINIEDFKYQDERGRYKKSGASLYQPSLEPRVNQRYYIECPDGSFVIPPGNVFPDEVSDGAIVKPVSNEDKCWRWSRETYLKKKDFLMFSKARKNCPLIDSEGNPSKWNVYDKVYYNEKKKETLRPEDVIYDYPNSKGTKELLELGISFSFAKPSGLIKYLMKISGLKNDDIILDFFGGSGTTAHACMQLNSEDNGKRRFIIIQLEESLEEKTEAYNKGYKTISELGIDRINKVGDKIVLKNPDSIIDTGFRVYKIE